MRINNEEAKTKLEQDTQFFSTAGPMPDAFGIKSIVDVIIGDLYSINFEDELVNGTSLKQDKAKAL